MVPLSTNIARQCARFFPGIRDTALLSALQGYMGGVEADDPKDIRLIVARCGGYLYFGGDPAHPQAGTVIRGAEAGNHLVSLEKAWVARFHEELGERGVGETRYRVKREMSRLDPAHLRALCALPEGFSLVQADETVAQALWDADWSGKYVRQFASARDLVERGFAFAVRQGRDIASMGCTFSIYDEGMELGIATNPAYRRRGLATAAAARTALEALRRGWELNWDAANPISLHLAGKIGFEPDDEYEPVLVKETLE